MVTDAEVQAHIDRLVDELKSKGAIRTEAVERAMRAVPRHLLVERYFDDDLRRFVDVRPEDTAELARIYSDRVLLTRRPDLKTLDDYKRAKMSSSSQPTIMAIMLEELRLEAGMRILEIGAGTGYNAALMAEIVGDQRLITTIDIQDDVVEQTQRLLRGAGYGGIKVMAGDGFFGWVDGAPYDRIVATVGCSDLSPHWFSQLANGGSVLVPLEQGVNEPLVHAWVDDGRVYARFAGWAGFMPIHGELFDEDNPQFRSVVTSDVIEEPAWPGFDARTELSPFRYFVGLRDRRAFSGGTGLWQSPQAWVTLKQGGFSRRGSPALAEELRALYDSWVSLGRPQPWDFEFEFVPRPIGRPPSGSEWTVERKFFIQHVRLSRGKQPPGYCPPGG